MIVGTRRNKTFWKKILSLGWSACHLNPEKVKPRQEVLYGFSFKSGIFYNQISAPRCLLSDFNSPWITINRIVLLLRELWKNTNEYIVKKYFV